MGPYRLLWLQAVLVNQTWICKYVFVKSVMIMVLGYGRLKVQGFWSPAVSGAR